MKNHPTRQLHNDHIFEWKTGERKKRHFSRKMYDYRSGLAEKTDNFFQDRSSYIFDILHIYYAKLEQTQYTRSRINTYTPRMHTWFTHGLRPANPFVSTIQIIICPYITKSGAFDISPPFYLLFPIIIGVLLCCVSLPKALFLYRYLCDCECSFTIRYINGKTYSWNSFKLCRVFYGRLMDVFMLLFNFILMKFQWYR